MEYLGIVYGFKIFTFGSIFSSNDFYFNLKFREFGMNFDTYDFRESLWQFWESQKSLLDFLKVF